MNYDLFGCPIIPEVEQLRIPYMGSKNKIATQLMRKMLDEKPKAKYFIDLFGGGGSMSFTAVQMGLKVHYNEKQTSLVNFIDYILERIKTGQGGKYGLFPDDFYKFITREEFNELKEEDSIKGQFARICYSFGNNQRNYLFGDIEKTKHLLHDIVMFRCKVSLKEFNKLWGVNYTISNAKTWNERKFHCKAEWNQRMKIKDCSKLEMLQQLQQLEQLEQLERLQQLEQLQQLERLQRLEQLERLEPLNNLTLSNLDYKNVKIETPIDETIVYLDPPYRGTIKYIEDVFHDEIDDYFKSSPYTCFMSEYKAPFKSILEIKKTQLMHNSKEKRAYALEQLYINKD